MSLSRGTISRPGFGPLLDVFEARRRATWNDPEARFMILELLTLEEAVLNARAEPEQPGYASPLDVLQINARALMLSARNDLKLYSAALARIRRALGIEDDPYGYIVETGGPWQAAKIEDAISPTIEKLN